MTPDILNHLPHQGKPAIPPEERKFLSLRFQMNANALGYRIHPALSFSLLWQSVSQEQTPLRRRVERLKKIP